MQTVYIVLSVLAFLFLLLWLGGGYFMFRFAVCRDEKRQNHSWDEPLKKWSTVTDEEFVSLQEGEKFIKSMLAEYVSIRSRDGLKLSARVYENPARRGVFMLVHGYRSAGLNDFSGAVTSIWEMGYSLLIIDQRAHGRSEGKYICYGAFERYDVVEWAKFAAARWEGLPLVLDGVSMGSATVMMGAGAGYPENVRAIIADCGYTTPGAICRKTMKQWFKLPAFPVFYGGKLWTKLLAKYDLDGVSATDALRCLSDKSMYEKPIPVLLAHGKADDFVPYSMSLENMKAFEDENGKTADFAELFSVENADHGLAFLRDKPGYLAAIGRLLDKAGLEHDKVTDAVPFELPDLSGLTR
ncbi:MAG: alpha/beta hydrolase [Clostridia bacterium]|nr:alpha/beta hydrolase [Clostridia bacterium]